MKQLTPEQIKALPKGTEVFVKFKTEEVQEGDILFYFKDADGIDNSFNHKQSIYLADDTDELDEMAKELFISSVGKYSVTDAYNSAKYFIEVRNKRKGGKG